MQGICKLFETVENLRESHIYPKFVIDYFKETGSKYLRKFVQPNKRLQDGPKLYLLSEKAEQRFSLREKWFSEKIFKPYSINGVRKFEYDENLFYFTISILWRTLLVNLDHPKISSQPFIQTLYAVSVEWKEFLRDFKYPTNYNRCYLLFTDRVKSHNIDASGADYYLTRALDATIVFNEDGSYLAVYMKFTRFIFWGVLEGGDDPKLGELKINPLKGKLTIPQNFQDPHITSFFLSRIKEVEKQPKANENQQERIFNEILKDKERFLKSDAGQSIINDYFNLDSHD